MNGHSACLTTFSRKNSTLLQGGKRVMGPKIVSAFKERTPEKQAKLLRWRFILNVLAATTQSEGQ